MTASQLGRPRVTAVLVNYRRADLTARAVASLLEQHPLPDVVVVDNAPLDDACRQSLRQFNDRVRLIESPENLGFARACNMGSATSDSECLLFFNNDAVALPGMISELLAVIDSDASIGIAGATVLDFQPPYRIQNFSPTLDRWGFPYDEMAGLDASDLPTGIRRRTFYVPGCALLIRRSLFEMLGGFDSGMFMFCEDSDLCWRSSLMGFDTVVSSDAQCRHEGGASAIVGVNTEGAYETSARRITLREQNTMRMMTTNLNRRNLFRYALLAPPAFAAELVIAAMLRKWDVASAYWAAVRGYTATFPEVLRRRSEVQSMRRRSDLAVLDLWSRRYEKLHFLRRVGMPSVRRFART